MEIKIGRSYKLSEKLVKELNLSTDEFRVIGKSGDVVMIHSKDGQRLSIKLSILIKHISSIQEPIIHFSEVADARRDIQRDNRSNRKVPQKGEQEVKETPYQAEPEEPAQKIVQEPVVEPKPEPIVEPEEEIVEPEPQPEPIPEEDNKEEEELPEDFDPFNPFGWN